MAYWGRDGKEPTASLRHFVLFMFLTGLRLFLSPLRDLAHAREEVSNRGGNLSETTRSDRDTVRARVLAKGHDRVFTGAFDERARQFTKFETGAEFTVAHDIAEALAERGFVTILDAAPEIPAAAIPDDPVQRETWSCLAREFLAARASRSPDTGCLVWQGSKNPDGYGTTKFLRRTHSAHRLAWIAHRGPIAPGLHVCHRCDNRLCLEPDHLFLGTPQQNTQDMIAKGRSSGFGSKRLAVADVATIKRRLLNGERVRDLAAEANVSPSTISDIKRGLTWAFVEPAPA